MKSGLPYNVMRYRDWDVAPRDPVTVTAFLFPNLVAAGTVGTFLATTAVSIGISLVTSWALSALAPKPKFGDTSSRGLLVNAKDPVSPFDLVYGETRKGGVVTYYETTPSDGQNTYLHQIIVLAGHEVHAIPDIYLNDEVVTLDGSGFVTSDPWNSKIRIKKHFGTAGQATDADLLAESEQIDNTFRGRGIAYLYVRYEYDQNVFPNGLPLVTAVVRGKKVFDPRTSATAWSNNAALCVRDYIASNYGLNDDQIDDIDFSAAANICDENVSLAVGGAEKRYTINGVAQATQNHGDVLQSMMTACAGSLFWGAGKWKLKVGDYVAPTKVLTLDDLRGPVSLSTRVNLQDQFNGVQGTFNDAAARWITTDYPPIVSAAFVSEDGGEQTMLDLALPFTTSAATAQRLAKLTLLRGREQMTLTADFGLNAFDVEVGEIIALTNPRYGWTEKEFEVVGWSFGSGEAGDLRVTLTLRETSEAAFDWSAEDVGITSGSTSLPGESGGLDINNLSASGGGRTQGDGTFVNSAILDWDAAANSFVDYYEVDWRPLSDSVFSSTTTEQSGIEVSPIIDGVEYLFRVRAVTVANIKGPYSTVQFTGGGDVTAPALPTDITATGGFHYINIEWTNPTDSDLNFVEVWEADADNSAAATKIGISAGSSFQRTNLGISVTKWYFLKSVDYSGNTSAFTTGVSGTTTFLDDDDFANGIYSLFTEQGLYAIEDVTSLPVAGDFTGQKVFNRTDGKLYEWNGTAWVLVVAAVEAPDISGQLQTAQIAVDAITNDLIATAAVQEENLANLAVTAAKVADNAITVNKVAADAITTAKLADNAATEAKIATSAITETKIATDAVTTPKIDAGAVTAGEIAAGAVIAGKIAADAVTAGTIAANAVTAGTIAANAVTATEIAADSITSAKIAAGAVTATEIAAGAVIADKIGAGAVTAAKIAADSITSDKIVAGTIQSNDIATGTITATQIAGNTITGDKVVANTITGGLLATSGIITDSAQLDNAVVTKAKIANAAIGTAKIEDLSVTTLKIAGQAVSNTGAASGSLTSIPSSAWVVLAQVTINTDGANTVIVHGNATTVSGAGGGGGTPGDGSIRIRVGSTTLHTVGLVQGEPSVALLGVGASSSGTTTAYIEGSRGGGDGSFSASGIIVITELKK